MAGSAVAALTLNAAGRRAAAALVAEAEEEEEHGRARARWKLTPGLPILEPVGRLQQGEEVDDREAWRRAEVAGRAEADAAIAERISSFSLYRGCCVRAACTLPPRDGCQ